MTGSTPRSTILGKSPPGPSGLKTAHSIDCRKTPPLAARLAFSGAPTAVSDGGL